ncbi:MAG: carbohydrate porin [Pirellulales bacterium]
MLRHVKLATLGLSILLSRDPRPCFADEVNSTSAIAAANNFDAAAEFDELAIPQHPGRRTPAPELTLPKAAQPRREETRHVGTPLHRDGSLPIPGKPSRGLAGPSETSAAAEASGIFQAFPHQIRGITGEYIYTSDLYSNARGGLATKGATRYLGNLDVVLSLDTEAQGLWSGGQLFMYANSLHGALLSPAFIGDYQFYDNLEASPREDDFTQVSEYWYYQEWLDGDLAVKIGRQDAGANFAFNDLGGDFINASFTLVPTVPLPTYPNPGWGLATFAKLTDEWQLSAGIYDSVFAGDSSNLKHLGTGGAVSLFQIEYKTQLGPQRRLPTTLRFGGFYHTGNWDEVTTAPNVGTFNSNSGYWATADQMLWVEPDVEDGQGLGAFFQAGWCPSDRNAVVQNFCSGLTYRGLIPDRDQDVLGAGFTSVIFGAAPKLATARLQKRRSKRSTAFASRRTFRCSPTCSLS